MPIETNIRNRLLPVTKPLSAERIPPLSESPIEKPTSLLIASNIKQSVQIVPKKEQEEPKEKPRNRDENRMDDLLKSLQLEQYKDTFSKEEIDFDVLCTLEEIDLKELGMPLGARRKILSYLKTMKGKHNRSTSSDKILEQETPFTKIEDQGNKNNTFKNPQVTNIKQDSTKIKNKVGISIGLTRNSVRLIKSVEVTLNEKIGRGRYRIYLRNIDE
jgi:hypothetical protein